MTLYLHCGGDGRCDRIGEMLLFRSISVDGRNQLCGWDRKSSQNPLEVKNV